MNLERAVDLLEPGQSAIVLFTRDMTLVERYPDGSGTSGNWVMNPDYHDAPDKVIIYNRVTTARSLRSEVYVADYTDAVPSPEEGRNVVHFKRSSFAGTTNRTWAEFAEGGTNPVRYLDRR